MKGTQYSSSLRTSKKFLVLIGIIAGVMADIFQNKKERYNINHAIFIIVALACLVGVAGLSKGSFNNYVDQILLNCDPYSL